MQAMDYDKDGYITEMDFVNMAHGYADAHNATPEKRDKLTRDFLYRKYAKAADTEKESRLTPPIFIDSIYQQLNDPELIACLDQATRGMFELMDVNQDGYLQPDEHKSMFANVGFPEGSVDAKATFDAIDTNGDGKLSIDEVIAAFLDFLFSQDESSPNKFFFGPLVD